MEILILRLILLAIVIGRTDAGYCGQYYSCTKSCSYSSKYYVSCGIFGWVRCIRYRTKYRSCSNMCIRLVCCTGYTGSSCSTPICYGSTSCPNGGTCTSPGVCRCRTGFASPRCADIDECKTASHGCQHTCENTIGSYLCKCRTGYRLASNQRSCVDGKECESGSHGCQHSCVNTIGSYQCKCRTGYTLDSDLRSCNDIDECKTESHGCQHTCDNTIGSYLCKCRTGYTLDSDLRSCNDIDECKTASHGCQHTCDNTIGSYLCKCRTGYTLDSDLRSCNDIDECKTASHGCQHTCENTIGSYLCKCRTGYTLDSDLRSCVDIDECSDGTATCEVHCNNTVGSYTCSCDAGYLVEENNTCLDINECLVDPDVCEQVCVNEPGSYHCDCSPGYKMDISSKCLDIDECAEDISGCSYNCTNQEGSFLCTCPSGYFLSDNGRTCEEIDDCQNVSCEHGGECSDGHNSFTCLCLSGFTGTYCEADIDECSFFNGGCQNNCTNIEGSFECSCFNDRVLQNDSVSCIGEDSDVVETVFEKYSISGKLLPESCFGVKLTSCINGKEFDINLTSTSEWYTMLADEDFVYSSGIVYAKISPFSLPVSLNGIGVSFINTSFEVKYNTHLSSSEGMLKVSHLAPSDCEALTIDNSDMFDILTADSFSKSMFSSFETQLPNWLEFVKSNHSAIAVQDMNSVLFYGRNMDTLNECSGAPVSDNHLYSLFRFGGGFSLKHLGTQIDFPTLQEARKFCFIADLCQISGGTIFLMIPEEARGLLLRLPFFKSLKDDLHVEIKPHAIGVSLVDGIDVPSEYSMITLWNGNKLFQYPTIHNADVWIRGDVEMSDSLLSVHGISDMYLRVPSVETLFTSMFREEWHGLINVRLASAPILRFRLFGDDYVVNFTLATSDLDAYLSIGGTNRKQCDEGVNPAGMFFTLFVNTNPFTGVPILEHWFNIDGKLFGFVAKDVRDIPSTMEHFSDEVLRISSLVNNATDILKRLLVEHHIIGNDAKFSLLGISKGLTMIKKTVDIDIKSGWVAKDIDGFISSIERLRQQFTETKHVFKQYLDAVEFVPNENIQTWANVMKIVMDRIQTYMITTHNSITESLLKETGNYTTFGLKVQTDVSILGLQFPSVDLELVYTEGSLFQCTRFENVNEIFRSEDAIRFLGEFFYETKLGRFLDAKDGIEGALALESYKVALNFQAVVEMLGINTDCNVSITSDNGLYFYLAGNVWNVFVAQINVSAEVERDWYDVMYILEGRFVTKSFDDSYLDGLRKTVNMVSNAAHARLSNVHDSFNYARKGVDNAEKWVEEQKIEVTNANKAFDKAISSLEYAKEELAIAKGPFRDAVNQLHAAQRSIDNLCQIRTCSTACISGIRCGVCHMFKYLLIHSRFALTIWIAYPCCRRVVCLYRIPYILCEFANFFCREMRMRAYTALENANIYVKSAMLAFDLAQATVAERKLSVDNSRVVLQIAEDTLHSAQEGLELSKGILKEATLALEAVKYVVGAAANVLQLVTQYGVQNLLDVRNCEFEIELATHDLAVFDVSCDVNAFRFGWKRISMTINFKNAIQSIWQAARATITALMETLGNAFGRQRRNIEYQTSSLMHKHLRIIRQSEDFQEFSQNDTIDITQNIKPTDRTVDTDAAYRIRSYEEKCSTMERFQDFLQAAFGVLQETVNESKAYMDDIESVKDDVLQYNDTNTQASNLTAEDVGISKDYAAKDYNMTEEDVDTAMDETRSTATDDPIVKEIKKAANASLHNIDKETKNVESIDYVNIWYTAMDNMTIEYFNATECDDFRDCMFYTISSLYELYEAEEFPNASIVRQSILDLESVVIESFQNESSSIAETSDAMNHIVNEISRIVDTNPFCSEAPTIIEHPDNATVLIGTDVTFRCLAVGDPEPFYWWFMNDILITEEQISTYTLINITESDHGSKINCMAGNIVANITSIDAYLLTTDYDIDECIENYGNCEHECMNTIGSYTCLCPDGYTVNITDGRSCHDADECHSTSGNQCEQVCNNFIGRFNCSCDEGFILNMDGQSCEDVDECDDDSNVCDYQCVNHDGSFKCICDEGYVGNGSFGHCVDDNECAIDNGGCEQTCINTNGSFTCDCRMGYEIDVDDLHCNDINECNEDNAGCEHRCVNTEGAYNCSCSTGYILEDDLQQCSDIDECQINDGGCEHHCNNTYGSFVCDCNNGYKLDGNGYNCSDIDECSVNNGNCSQTCINSIASYECDCLEGYLLSTDGFQCIDVDECLANSSICHHECVNTNGGFSCRCTDGYALDDDNRTCSDIDECLTNNGGCEDSCSNVEGTFNCSCFSGYILAPNDFSCLDIDECAENNGSCEHMCTNNDGSYQCSCSDGYELIDELKCVDRDECEEGTHECQHECMNIDGDYVCRCHEGYALADDGKHCTDIDECSIDNGECAHVCTNKPGNYSCSCDTGYTLATNDRHCEDIDECQTDEDNCEHQCNNTHGSFSCDCNDGYKLDGNGYNCSDIDECSANNGNCSQTCINSIASYVCDCLEGYLLSTDGFQCIDVDECLANSSICHHECVNTDGGFSCRCTDGYALDDDNRTCSDIDECLTNNGGCEDSCSNVEGTFNCSCFSGYILAPNGFGCLDIDECAENNGSCEHMCTNNDGSYQCSCLDGYELIDELKCIDRDECKEGTHECQHECVNIDGGYVCKCHEGYALADDGKHCTDVNECLLNNGECAHVCTNKLGTHICSCETGYALATNGRHCEDIDECLMNTGGCQQLCINTIGSFHCECHNDFVLQPGGYVCLKGRSEKSFHTSVSVDFVVEPISTNDGNDSEARTLTDEFKQSLQEFYIKYTSVRVIVVIHFIRSMGNHTDIDYTIVYDKSESTALVQATLDLSSGAELHYKGAQVGTWNNLPENVTGECNLLEVLNDGCGDDWHCEITNEGPECLFDGQDLAPSDNIVAIILPTVGVTTICAVAGVVFVCMRIRKRKKMKLQERMTIELITSD